MLLGGGHAADQCIAAIGQKDDRVVPEQVRDGVFIIAEVARIGGFQVLVGGFQLDKDQRDAVDKAEQVGSALVVIAGDPKLGGEEEIIFQRVLPIDEADRLDGLGAIRVAVGDLDAVFEQ